MTPAHQFKSHIPEPALFLLPNLFTTGNLFFGALSLYMVIQGQIYQACLCILAATVFDIFDGRIARLAGTSTLFGAEYDSLCDLVSFGVAPGVLVYHWGFDNFGRLGWVLIFIYLVCGALRLARYNAQVKNAAIEKNYFQGLPIPAAANFFATLILFCTELDIDPFPKHCLMALLILMSLLMVSNIPFRSFKKPNFLGKKLFTQLVVLVLFVLVIFAKWEINLFLATSLYILINLLLFLSHLISKALRSH